MRDHIYLAHHGIKGMKWGVRRFRNEDGTLTSAGKERYSGASLRKQVRRRIAGFDNSHRDKLISKYREKGMSQKDAEAAAEKRISVEKKIAIGAGIAAAAVATYATYKYVSSDKLDLNVNLDSQLMRKTFESSDFDTAINDDLRKINRGGWAGHILLNGREVNCTSCSMAYEMRRRGYDVVAGRRMFFGRTNEEMERFFQGAKFQALAADHVPSKEGPALYQIAEKELLGQGEGARGVINGWYLHGGGHSIAYEVHDGKVHFVDGQIGRQYKNAQSALGLMGSFDYLRTDTLALTNDAAETVMNNTKRSLLTELPSKTAVVAVAVGADAVAKRTNGRYMRVHYKEKYGGRKR